MWQIKIWEERKAQPLAILRPHEGHPVFSATFFTAPNQPDHIVLITAVSELINFYDITSKASEFLFFESHCRVTFVIITNSIY